MITTFILALLGLCIYIATSPENFARESNRVFMKIGHFLGYVVEMLNPIVKIRNNKK